MFADDSNCFITEKSLPCLKSLVEESLRNIYDWSKANSLSLNVKKTNLIIFRPKRKNIDPVEFKFYNETIIPTTQLKFLGVTLNENLDFSLHIEEASKKVSKIIGIINRNGYIFPFKIKLLLYYALV